jgi:hypothetical protein
VRVNVEMKTVWVEDLECCGDSFSVGSMVSWPLHSVDEERGFFTAVFGEDTAQRITDGYERHGQSWAEPTSLVEGIVRSIEGVSWLVHPRADDSALTDDLGRYALPGSLVISARASAARGDEVGGRSCMGYLVDLEVVVTASRDA